MASSLDTRRIKGLVRNRLLRDSDEPDVGLLSPPERRMVVQGVVKDVLRQERAILSVGALAEVVNEVSDEVVGLGPIERLLKDPEISEVMVNGTDDVYVERKGRVEKAEGLWFEGEAQVLHLNDRSRSTAGSRRHLLSGFLRCHRCGEGLAGRRRAKGPRYECIGAPTARSCGRTTATAAPVDELVTKMVFTAIDSPALVEALRDRHSHAGAGVVA